MSTDREIQQWLVEAKSDVSSVWRSYDESTCIFSAPRGLLKEYEEAYVPRIVSIGPYHFLKEELREMERFKGEAVRRELVRIQNKLGQSDFSFEGQSAFSFDQLIDRIFGKVGQILRCYDKEIPYIADVVCWMMARDACFILEFFRSYVCQSEDADWYFANDEDFLFRQPLHPIFGLKTENHVLKSEIMRDLIKLENQIPLFVLEEVVAMEMRGSYEDAKSKLQRLLKAVFNKIYYQPFNFCAVDESPWQHHILDIYYYCCLGALRSDSNHLEEERMNAMEMGEEREWSKFPSAVQLHYGGVKIEASGKRVEDVSFEDRTLSIPAINLDVECGIFIRNLIALEICSPCGPLKRMTAFVQFMNELCQTEKGIRVLRDEGVIVGNLDHSRILQLWNSLKSSNLKHFQPKCQSIHSTRVKLTKGYSTNRSIVYRSRWNGYVGSKPWLVAGAIGAIIGLLFSGLQVLCLFVHCPAR